MDGPVGAPLVCPGLPRGETSIGEYLAQSMRKWEATHLVSPDPFVAEFEVENIPFLNPLLILN